MQENQLSDAVCERLFSYFPAMPRLARLNLNNNLLGDDGTEALAAALQHAQHLTELDLSANAALDEAGALALAQHLQPGLERLDVSGSAVTEGAERALSQLPCWPDNQVRRAPHRRAQAWRPVVRNARLPAMRACPCRSSK